MAIQVLTSTNDLTRQAWLEARRKGIGGSDVSAIVGLNPWKSAISVYMEKTGEIGEVEENEKMYWGNRLEDLVADEFMKRTDMKVRRRNAILRHPEYKWMLANVDRMIVGRKEGLECKTAGQFMASEWDGEEVPAQYLLQCQWYMAVTGYKAWWIAVLIGGQEFVYKRIERDEGIINHLIDECGHFWHEYVLKEVPPAFDGSRDSEELLKKLYPTADPDSETELPDEADELIKAYMLAKEEEKEAKETKQRFENQLKNMIGEFETGYADHHIVTWKPITSNRLDTKRFKADHPDLFEQYAKESSYRRFDVKEAN